MVMYLLFSCVLILLKRCLQNGHTLPWNPKQLWPGSSGPALKNYKSKGNWIQNKFGLGWVGLNSMIKTSKKDWHGKWHWNFIQNGQNKFDLCWVGLNPRSQPCCHLIFKTLQELSSVLNWFELCLANWINFMQCDNVDSFLKHSHHVTTSSGLDLLHQGELWLGQQLKNGESELQLIRKRQFFSMDIIRFMYNL